MLFLKRLRKPKPQTDADYVAAYRATGDLNVLGELYERHMELVYAVCYKYLRDEAESKDAVMQLFEQLVVDLRRHEVGNFRSWLHSVARNYCLMHLRRQREYAGSAYLAELAEQGSSTTLPGPATDHGVPNAPIPGNVVEPPFDDDDDASLMAYRLEQLMACLPTLPPEQRRCLELFYWEQQTYAQIVATTGYDLKQVKSYLQNGRRNLRLCLERRHE